MKEDLPSSLIIRCRSSSCNEYRRMKCCNVGKINSRDAEKVKERKRKHYQLPDIVAPMLYTLSPSIEGLGFVNFRAASLSV